MTGAWFSVIILLATALIVADAFGLFDKDGRR